MMWVGRVKGHCTLTGVHPADLLNEGLIKTCDNSAAYWNHEVLVQALHKGVDPPDTSALRTQTGSHPNAPAAPPVADICHCFLTCCIRCMHLDACTPYALFTMCGTSYLAHMVASSSSLGGD